jgi:hypothetical protein
MVARTLGIGLMLGGSAVFADQPASSSGNWPPFRPRRGEHAAATSTPVPIQTQPNQAQTIVPVSATPVIFQPAATDPRQVPLVVLSPAGAKDDTRVVQVQPGMRQAGGQGLRGQEETEMYAIQLEVPSLERVTRRESERNLQERIRQEAKNRPDIGRIDFPYEPPISTERYVARSFPPMTCEVEPNYLCHRRLYFEDRNSERFGWDLGPIQPLVSSGIFFWDVLTLPYQLGTDPCRHYECNAGYCLPGDPVPYYLYPPQLSITGAVLQGGTVVALVGIFPS